jgi:tRNA pseudouridine55 synthase
VVQRVRRALKTRAVGHTGTLDPFATGLLVILVGRATRLARFVESEAKTYLATARLGVATDTDDRTGTPVGPPADPSGLSEARVGGVLAELAGEQRQRPPHYSAKHVEGERSYRLARRGVAVDLAETSVVVHRIELVAWASPELVFRATVSAGTYIRALARDLGERLGVGAHLTALRRESIGALRADDAIPLEQVDPSAVRPARAVLGHLPAVELDEQGRTAVSHGRAVPAETGPGGDAALAGDVALTFAGELVAVARAGDGWLRPSVVLGTP